MVNTIQNISVKNTVMVNELPKDCSELNSLNKGRCCISYLYRTDYR